MSTFEIKMTILNILGESSTEALAESLYQWVMQELEVEDTTAKVTPLKTVQ